MQQQLAEARAAAGQQQTIEPTRTGKPAVAAAVCRRAGQHRKTEQSVAGKLSARRNSNRNWPPRCDCNWSSSPETNQLAEAEKQQLANQLQLAEVEAHAAAERAALMQQEVQVQQAENARLAEGFKSLATNSSQLTQEIRANTALAPNTIFSDFVSNRVEAGIYAWRTGLFSMDTTKDKQTATVLVTDGTNYFALCHVQDTPVTLWDPGTDWDKLAGTLSWSGNRCR